MIQAVPALLKNYIPKAKQFKNDSCLQEVEFSGPTYQMKIWDPETEMEAWTFLQLKPQGVLGDAFCSCHENEAEGCWHLALAYLSLFDASKTPIHERFYESLWNGMGKAWFKRFGEKRPKKDTFKLPGWEVEDLTPEGKKFFNDVFRIKPVETEENSIKFSNLTEEELEAWRAGNPPFRLAYELSPWSDLAKALMLHSNKHKFKINFVENAKTLPKELLIEFPDFKVRSTLLADDWEELIPVLNSVLSNLHVFNRLQDSVSQVKFDHEKEQFNLTFKPLGTKEVKKIKKGEWDYVVNKGFYPHGHEFKSIIRKDEIESFLTRYYDEMSTVMPDVKWHEAPVELHFYLEFDGAWRLHLVPFVFEGGDLDHFGAHLWGRFCYIPQKGFYKILHKPQDDFPTVIEEADLPDFIRKYASWLNQQPGFETHVGSLETQILYSVDKQGNLSFERRLTYDRNQTKEFGPWIYLKGEGFFNKIHSHVHLPVDLGQLIRPERIPSFIRENRQDLELIPGFFLEENPIQEVNLEVRLEAKDRICVEPHLHLKTAYKDIPMSLYEEWIYLEGKGFYELTPDQRLPEKVRTPLWIATDGLKTFLEDELPHLDPWIQKIDPRLEEPLTLRLILTSIKEATHHSWKLKFLYQTERGDIFLDDILEGLRKKKQYLFHPAGRIALFDERFRWLKRIKPENIFKDNEVQLSTAELIKLHAYEEITPKGESADLFRNIIELKMVLPFDPAEMKGALRPYQKNGAEWLLGLYSYLLGGLLCDEMGLGKTHQAMALMAAIRKLKPDAKFLVVCPTSVLYHWEDKVKEYFPSIDLFTFHGTFRRKDIAAHQHLLLTSYGILRTDIEWFKEKHFDLIVYDEIQVAKNYKSKLYGALQQVRGDMKIGLTGTPIENHLRELKTLFDLVLPGYMPSDSDYMKMIVKPIEKERDMQRKGLLQRLTHPFVLRRQKKDVMKDLPDKTEEISHCDLHPTQEKLYREVLLLQRDELMKDLFDLSKPVPFLHVFSLLSRLKQICDHPALYFKTPDDYLNYHSGKWELFLELLREARDSAQKVVVYSQYLGMLDIIESHLKAEGIGFASLRGSTRDRKEQVTLFTQDPNCEVFVASLKAAGLGIDLTAASVVIHYDRWWTAARENQATDRVHRFGQHRGVQVFKLVTKNTFEERIHQIIERKKELLDETIAIDDHEALKTFTREELYQLLQYAEPSEPSET